MERIKFITDSSSDITHGWAEEYDIEVLPMGINVNGQPFHEGIDFTNEEFYELMSKEKDIPTTSAINSASYFGALEKYLLAGQHDRIVVIMVGSELSSSYGAALMARDAIWEKYPDAKEKLQIDIYDSGSASAGYGFPIMQSIQWLREGKPYSEIKAYLEDWFASFEVYFTAFSFDVVRKSGRVNAPTAYIGEKLNIRPMMVMMDGVFSPFAKVRGDANVPKKLLEIAKEKMREGSPYILLNGTQPDVGERTLELFEKEFGYPCAKIFQPGPAMVVNAGPKMMCLGFLGKRRR